MLGKSAAASLLGPHHPANRGHWYFATAVLEQRFDLGNVRDARFVLALEIDAVMHLHSQRAESDRGVVVRQSPLVPHSHVLLVRYNAIADPLPVGGQ